MSIRITCINKDGGNHENPHAAIRQLGWINESSGERNRITRIDLYNWIKNQGGQAYVKDAYGNIAYVGTAVTSSGTQFVRTYADKTWTDNLLSLPEC